MCKTGKLTQIKIVELILNSWDRWAVTTGDWDFFHIHNTIDVSTSDTPILSIEHCYIVQRLMYKRGRNVLHASLKNTVNTPKRHLYTFVKIKPHL
jgi:hypothetical protein